MKEQISENYYLQQKQKLLKYFDRFSGILEKELVNYYNNELGESLSLKTRHEFENLIPEIPYIGGTENTLTWNLIGATMSLALYKVLKEHGKSLEDAARINFNIYITYFNSFSVIKKLLLRIKRIFKFSGITKKRIQKLAERSQKRQYPYDFIFTYIEGDGKKFDFGIDYTECAICKFFNKENASEFTRYVCLFDFPASQASGSGLERTMTLAEGKERCDFRYKKGREVKIPLLLTAKVGKTPAQTTSFPKGTPSGRLKL